MMASKSSKRGGLGRGLGSLIPTAPAAELDDGSRATGAESGAQGSAPDNSQGVVADAVAPEPTPDGSDARTAAGPAERSPDGQTAEGQAAEAQSPNGQSADGQLANGQTPHRETSDGQPAESQTPSDKTADGHAQDIDATEQVADGRVPATETHETPSGDARLQPVAGAAFAELDVASIRANPRQPRQVFDEEALEELAHSVREFGVLQPIVVRPLNASEREGDIQYELVMGERRLRAVIAAGLEVVPAIVRSTADDEMLRDALLENLHRVQLNPLEEAAAYQQLLEEFGATHDELAQRIGRSRSQVSNTIRLLNLPVPVQRRVAAGVLSAGHARALLGLDERDAQDELAARIVAEGLSVRATEELVALAAQDRPRKAARRAAPKITAPAIAELSENLSDRFDTRVLVDIGRRKGKLTIEFGSIDDLERIVGMIAPDLATRRPAVP